MSEATWDITPHVCSACLGRVLRAQGSGLYRCSSCDVETADGPAGICGCGIAVGPIAMRAGLAGSRFHCGPNPRRGADSPAQISILFGDPGDAVEPAKAEAAGGAEA